MYDMILCLSQFKRVHHHHNILILFTSPSTKKESIATCRYALLTITNQDITITTDSVTYQIQTQ